MLPKTHIILGAVFAFLVWLIFDVSLIYTFYVFFSSFLIDFDHYLVYALKKKSLSMKKANKYFVDLKKILLKHIKKGEKVKAPLMFFHTIEFILLIFFLSFYSKSLVFILIGMLFHSLLDIIDIYATFKTLSPRHFSLLLYLAGSKEVKQL